MNRFENRLMGGALLMACLAILIGSWVDSAGKHDGGSLALALLACALIGLIGAPVIVRWARKAADK